MGFQYHGFPIPIKEAFIPCSPSCHARHCRVDNNPKVESPWEFIVRVGGVECNGHTHTHTHSLLKKKMADVVNPEEVCSPEFGPIRWILRRYVYVINVAQCVV
jgi:hypothetical protein